MPCKHLKTGWRWKNGRIYESLVGTKLGKEPTTRPCGQCIDCRLDKSREWAIRCKHESTLHEKNCVVTLTYADEHLPANGSIDPDAGSEFMKRLRAREQYKREQIHLPWHPDFGIKTFGCAEYGCNDPKCGRAWCQHNMRPHYHIILFNYDFEDKKFHSKNEDGDEYFTSDILETTWKQGGCQIMELNWKTAAYVSRYVTKKLSGPGRFEFEQKRVQQGRQKHYYGEKLPEQSICVAQQEGIAGAWWKENKDKIHKSDVMWINGQKIRPVTYYDRKYEKQNPNEYKKIKEKREKEKQKKIEKIKEEIRNGIHTNNFQRMDRQLAHERVMEAKLKLLKRGL